MTGIADDADSVMGLVGEAARRLAAKEPEHELLGYLKEIDDDGVYAAFVERFGKKEIPGYQRSNALNVTWMYAQYLVALHAALGEKPSAPPPRVEVKSETERREDKLGDTPIPF